MLSNSTKFWNNLVQTFLAMVIFALFTPAKTAKRLRVRYNVFLFHHTKNGSNNYCFSDDNKESFLELYNSVNKAYEMADLDAVVLIESQQTDNASQWGNASYKKNKILIKRQQNYFPIFSCTVNNMLAHLPMAGTQ